MHLSNPPSPFADIDQQLIQKLKLSQATPPIANDPIENALGSLGAPLLFEKIIFSRLKC